MAAKKSNVNSTVTHHMYRIEKKAPGSKSWGLETFARIPADENGGVNPAAESSVWSQVEELKKPTAGGVKLHSLDDPVYRAGLASKEMTPEVLASRNLNGYQFRVRRAPITEESMTTSDGFKGTRTVRPAAEDFKIIPAPEVAPPATSDLPDVGTTRPAPAGLIPIKPHGNTGNPKGNLGKGTGWKPGPKSKEEKAAAAAAAAKKPAARKPAAKKTAAPTVAVTVSKKDIDKAVAKKRGGTK